MSRCNLLPVYGHLLQSAPCAVTEADGCTMSNAHDASRSVICPRQMDAEHSVPSATPGMPAGSSKLVVQSAEVLDLTGATGSTPSTPPGVIFCPWNPDESYARDALIRVQARVGTPELACVIYEHLEILVHPLGVHLTERVASQFWVRTWCLTCLHCTLTPHGGAATANSASGSIVPGIYLVVAGLSTLPRPSSHVVSWCFSMPCQSCHTCPAFCLSMPCLSMPCCLLYPRRLSHTARGSMPAARWVIYVCCRSTFSPRKTMPVHARQLQLSVASPSPRWALDAAALQGCQAPAPALGIWTAPTPLLPPPQRPCQPKTRKSWAAQASSPSCLHKDPACCQGVMGVCMTSLQILAFVSVTLYPAHSRTHL